MITSPAIDGLDPAQRAQLAALWQMRAESESSVRGVFVQLVDEFVAAGAHADVIALARRAAEDEARHARICAELAAAYRGDATVDATPAPLRLPRYVDDVRLRAALHAVNLCCIGETIATAFVEACVADCAFPELRDIHGRHLADEIHHARVGWAHVASLAAEERAEIAARLPELVRVQVETWEARLAELPEAGIAGHGYPSRATLLAAVHAAMRDLVLPGFDYVGIDTAAPRAWFAARLECATGTADLPSSTDR